MDPVPSIATIKENWPYIFHEECLIQHFLQSTKIKEDSFLKNFNESKDLTLKFFETMYNKETKKDFEKEECSENIIIRSVLKYFNENESYLFHIFEIGTTLQEVVGRIPTNTPLIAFVSKFFCTHVI
ncbi:uncharacterized protein LOC118734133 [Rhagoletis pomonella]|uniref:uncharacterized protein LOC118734133 n=1 Tax=Rhagoletis pomonella TaxID=28610 RepID=UPI0017802BAA|nr:uncharacterized protein LOC118734133 [Rhagoletis pomonella]